MKGRLMSVSCDDDSSCLAFSQIDRWMGCLKVVGEPVDDPLVEVFAAEIGVAVGRFDLEDAVLQLEDRNIERAAAEVVDSDQALLVAALVETVGERCGRGLVDDPFDFEALK